MRDRIFLVNSIINANIPIIIIDKSNSKYTVKILKEKLDKNVKAGNLRKHFGKLKRNIDVLEYQLAVRENEN